MHEYLRSIGFRSIETKKQLKTLLDWVLESPDRLSIVALDNETNLAQATREIGAHAGISVVGEIDEQGKVVPEYYFPYIASAEVSSSTNISYEKQAARDGFVGMCEDYRLGLSLIFAVRNVADVYRMETLEPFGTTFKSVNFSALAVTGTVLLPLAQTAKVLQQGRENENRREKLMESAHNGDPEAIEKLTAEDMERYRNMMEHLRSTDVFTLVDNFFMPHGMESDQYYFMGTIRTCALQKNDLTGESFYRMTIESNGLPLCVAINEKDLIGIPQEGYRLKCRGWLLGELNK